MPCCTDRPGWPCPQVAQNRSELSHSTSKPAGQAALHQLSNNKLYSHQQHCSAHGKVAWRLSHELSHLVPWTDSHDREMWG